MSFVTSENDWVREVTMESWGIDRVEGGRKRVGGQMLHYLTGDGESRGSG